MPPKLKPGFEVVEVIDGPGEEIIEVIETIGEDIIEVRNLVSYFHVF